MPGSGLSSVGNSANLTVVCSASDLVAGSSNGPITLSSTRFSSSSVSSSVISATSTTSTFAATKRHRKSHAVVPSDASFSVTYTVAVPTTTSGSTTPVAYDPMPTVLDTTSPWAASFAHHGGPAAWASTSTEKFRCRRRDGCFQMPSKASTSAHTITKPPKPPQQIVSTSTLINAPTTRSGSDLLTAVTSGSLIPIPTGSSNMSLSSSSTSNTLLPFILGPVLGVLVIVALGIIVFRCSVRRRSKNMTNVLSISPEAPQERKDWMMIEGIPRANAVALGRRIISYQGSSTHTPEHRITCLSHAGNSPQISSGQFSDAPADNSGTVISRTRMRPPSISSVDSVSTLMVPINVDPRDIREFRSSIDASTSSLELHFVAPLTTDDSSTRSPYFSPSWHYDGQSPTSSFSQHWNGEQRGETSPASLRTSPPVSPRSFPLGTESARLHLHALLEEARRI